jgi:hypothetical protein
MTKSPFPKKKALQVVSAGLRCPTEKLFFAAVVSKGSCLKRANRTTF